MKNLNEKFETIREEIDHLKKRMDSIQDILNSQEELLEILTENTKFLLTDAINNSKQLSSEEEIMKSAFTNRKLPNILKK